MNPYDNAPPVAPRDPWAQEPIKRDRRSKVRGI